MTPPVLQLSAKVERPPCRQTTLAAFAGSKRETQTHALHLLDLCGDGDSRVCASLVGLEVIYLLVTHFNQPASDRDQPHSNRSVASSKLEPLQRCHRGDERSLRSSFVHIRGTYSEAGKLPGDHCDEMQPLWCGMRW